MESIIDLTEKKSHFSCSIPVRIDDINFGGHLDHTRVLTYTHQTRAQFLKRYQQSEIDCFGSMLVMLELNAKYKAEGFFTDEIICNLYVAKVEKVTITFYFNLYNSNFNKTLAQITTVMGCLNPEKRKLSKPSEAFRDFFHGFTARTL